MPRNDAKNQPSSDTRLKSLSILIPVFNNDCTMLVADLLSQGMALEGVEWEIFVAEDGSTETASLTANRQIGSWPHCRHIIREENVGRSRIRNYLGSVAQYPWLLFIDSHMRVVKPDFLKTYVEMTTAYVIDGDYTVSAHDEEGKNTLRYRYEKACERQHSLETRQTRPYAGFHTANFMIEKELFLRMPFKDSFVEYGYEDVLYGAQLEAAGIEILHIDNPVNFGYFESNARFIDKTEAAMRSLSSHCEELGRYSRMLSIHDTLKRWHLRGMVNIWQKLTGNRIRSYLTTKDHPSLMVFNLYRIGYFCHCMSKII